MDKKQEFLMRACQELGLNINLDFIVDIAPARKIIAQAHLPRLGGPNGTLIFRSFEEYPGVDEELANLGYSVSRFSEPLECEEFDLNSWAEMFAEWGWSGPEADRPTWLKFYDSASE